MHGPSSPVYMAAGVTPVCQNEGYCDKLIHDGGNGMLAGNLEEWEWKLDELISSRELRAKMSRNAFCTAAGSHTFKPVFDRFVEAVKCVITMLHIQGEQHMKSEAPTTLHPFRAAANAY